MTKQGNKIHTNCAETYSRAALTALSKQVHSKGWRNQASDTDMSHPQQLSLTCTAASNILFDNKNIFQVSINKPSLYFL